MTELPDDMADWPSDIFKLFGLPRSTDPKSLRRVYFRLIKTFRPDSHPAEFQRIHKAYQSAQSFLKTRSNRQADSAPSRIDLESDSAPSNVTATESTGQNASKNPPSSNPSRASPDTDQAIQRFWELASKGLWEESAVVANNIQPPEDRTRAESAQYFLQRASTDRQLSDQSEKRINLLLQQIVQPDFYHNAFSSLANEFENRTELALLDVVRNFIADRSHEKCAHAVTQLRWKAIGLEKPEIVVADMRDLYAGFSTNINYIAAESLEYTIWSTSPDLDEHNRFCLDLLNEAENDLADTAELLSLSAKELSGKSITLYDSDDIGLLVPESRIGFKLRSFDQWLRVISRINENRSDALTRLESRIQQCPFSMALFVSGLDRFARAQLDAYRRYDHLAENAFDQEVATFLRSSGRGGFAEKHRLRAVEFCIDYQISPAHFGALLDTFTEQNPEHLLWHDTFEKDTALNCVYFAGIADRL